MTQAIQKKLNDSAFARWTALILVALTMFFGYMFVDVLSPLQNMLESTRGWSPTIFGLYGGSEFILNVCGFLLVAGIILDKMGVRFTGILSASLMVLGAGIKFYGLSNYFYEGGFGYEFLSSFLTDIPASAKLACLGFMVFGCGTEMAGVTVSRAIVTKSFETGDPMRKGCSNSNKGDYNFEALAASNQTIAYSPLTAMHENKKAGF